MLIRLLRTHLRDYRRVLLVLLGLQAIQAIANLYLPNLNASIIDKGVLRGDTGYIWTLGGVMLAVTLVQAVFAVAAFYLGARVAIGVRTRRPVEPVPSVARVLRAARSTTSARRR